jgi:hypothetical protein
MGAPADEVVRIMDEPISFRIVKEPYGWAVRNGHGMMTPFRSRALALEHANGIAEALRQRGEAAQVILEEPTIGPPASRVRPRSRFTVFWS